MAARGDINAEMETMKMMNALVLVLKMEYGASEGTLERPFSKSSVGEGILGTVGSLMDFSRMFSM